MVCKSNGSTIFLKFESGLNLDPDPRPWIKRINSFVEYWIYKPCEKELNYTRENLMIEVEKISFTDLYNYNYIGRWRYAYCALPYLTSSLSLPLSLSPSIDEKVKIYFLFKSQSNTIYPRSSCPFYILLLLYEMGN